MSITTRSTGRVLRVIAEPTEASRAILELADHLERLNEDLLAEPAPPCVVALVSGPAAFLCPRPETRENLDGVRTATARLMSIVQAIEAPTIAMLDGDAIGPAWAVALACDLRVARGGIVLGSPEASCGAFPMPGVPQRLARLVGASQATELLLLGTELDAGNAAQRGLLTAVGATAGEAAAGLIDRLAAAAPFALAYAKEVLSRAGDLSMADTAQLEATLYSLLQTTRDRQEGLDAFAQRRPPVFEGR